jgi:hypothetical protein
VPDTARLVPALGQHAGARQIAELYAESQSCSAPIARSIRRVIDDDLAGQGDERQVAAELPDGNRGAAGRRLSAPSRGEASRLSLYELMNVRVKSDLVS